MNTHSQTLVHRASLWSGKCTKIGKNICFLAPPSPADNVFSIKTSWSWQRSSWDQVLWSKPTSSCPYLCAQQFFRICLKFASGHQTSPVWPRDFLWFVIHAVLILSLFYLVISNTDIYFHKLHLLKFLSSAEIPDSTKCFCLFVFFNALFFIFVRWVWVWRKAS